MTRQRARAHPARYEALAPAQSFTNYFVGVPRPDGGIEQLTHGVADPRQAFGWLKSWRRSKPHARVFKRSIFDSLVLREAT